MGSMPELADVEIFTDGACRGNPGPGGWAAILRYREVEKELSGYDPQTTNNRMEMMAAIAGLEACLLYTSPSPRDRSLSRMPSSA